MEESANFDCLVMLRHWRKRNIKGFVFGNDLINTSMQVVIQGG